MGVFDMLRISGSALSAERQRSEVIATNMANAETTHTDGGGPFKRKEVVFAGRATLRFIWPSPTVETRLDVLRDRCVSRG